MPAIINGRSARNEETELKYPVFFEIIRNHKAHQLYGAWAVTVSGGGGAEMDMTEFEREKKNLMKILSEYTDEEGTVLCKQPGVVIMRVLWKDWLIPPAYY